MNRSVSFACCMFLLLLTVSQSSAYWDEGGIAASAISVDAHFIKALPDSSGGVIVLWWEDYPSPKPGIYVQRIDADGNALWDSTGVLVSDSTSTPDEEPPQIVAVDDGWLVTWIQDLSGDNLHAALVDTSGNISDSESLGSIDLKFGQMRMTRVATNDVVLVWADPDQEIRAMYIYEDLTSDTLGVLSDSLHVNNPFVVSMADSLGSAMVVWEKAGHSYGPWTVGAQRINSSEGAVWESVITVVDWDSDDCQIDVVSDNNGGAFIALDHENEDIIIQLVDYSGNVTWSTGDSIGRRICASCTEDFAEPAVAMDLNGDVVIAFERSSSRGQEIYASKIALTEESPELWSQPVRVQAAGGEVGFNPRIAKNTTGGTVVTWQSGDDGYLEKVYAQSLNSLGDRFWDDDVLLTERVANPFKVDEPVIVEEDHGGAYVGWTKWSSNSDATYINRLVRISDLDADAVYSRTAKGGYSNKQYWDLDVSFNVEGGKTKARIYHGPYDCDQVCDDYSRVTVADVATDSHRIRLDDNRDENDQEYHGDLDPVSMYCYRVVPGGLPAYVDSIPLQLPHVYPRVINGEETVIIPDTSCAYDNGKPCFWITDGSESYDGHLHVGPENQVFEQYIPSVHMPELLESDRRMGSRSISFRTDSIPFNPTDKAKQRCKFYFQRGIPFQETRYEGFSMKITLDSECPVNTTAEWTVLTEWWQDKECYQPLILYLRPGNKLLLRLANDEHTVWKPEATECYIGKGPISIVNEEIEFGRWYDIIIGYCFDPYGDCGFVEMWIDRKSVGRYPSESGTYGKVGFPEPWYPYGAANCANHPDTVYSDIRQAIRVHPLGIYRRATDKNLEVHFDEIKQGFTYQEVVLPRIKISNPEIVTTFDSLTSRWDASFTFETDTVTSVTLSYGPITDGCTSCGYSQETTVTGTNHIVVLEDIQWAPSYCYRVKTNETPTATELTGSFDLKITHEMINNVASELDSTECKLNREKLK